MKTTSQNRAFSSSNPLQRQSLPLEGDPAVHSLRSAADYCGITSAGLMASYIKNFNVPHKFSNNRYYIRQEDLDALMATLAQNMAARLAAKQTKLDAKSQRS